MAGIGRRVRVPAKVASIAYSVWVPGIDGVFQGYCHGMKFLGAEVHPGQGLGRGKGELRLLGCAFKLWVLGQRGGEGGSGRGMSSDGQVGEAEGLLACTSQCVAVTANRFFAETASLVAFG